MQPALLDLPPQQPRRVEVPGVINPVARVVLDVPVYHLNQPFDYLIPEKLGSKAHVGMRVGVRFGRRKQQGWIVDRGDTTTHHAKLAEIDSVIGRVPVLTQPLFELAKHMSIRAIAPLSDVLTAAIPKRHASAEKKLLDEIGGYSRSEPLIDLADDNNPLTSMIAAQPFFEPLPELDTKVLHGYMGGEEFLEAIEQGQHPRAICDVVPDQPGYGRDPFDILTQGTLASLRSGRKALLIVPTHDMAMELTKRLRALLGAEPVIVLTASLEPAARYRAYLQALLGRTRVVVGTVSAAMTPMSRLGFIGLCDDGDHRLRMRRSPYIHARHIINERSYRENAAQLFVGYTRSAYSHFLIQSGWAQSLTPTRKLIAKATPKVTVFDPSEHVAESKAALTRFPPQAHKVISGTLEKGPVAVLVPRTGYIPVVGCSNCGEAARCSSCHGYLEMMGRGGFRCKLCGRSSGNYRCPQCHGHGLRAYQIGSERTGYEFGKMFPRVPITVSSSTSLVVDNVGPRPRIVISTPSATPVAEEGYHAGVILDTATWLRRPELDSAEQALRAWQTFGALIRPGAPLFLVGWPGHVLSAALSRWDSTILADEVLHEFHELHFPPAYFVAKLSGSYSDVQTVMRDSDLPDNVELLGPIPAGDNSEDFQGIIRCEHRFAQQLATTLHQIQVKRSVNRLRLVKIEVDPRLI